MSESETADNATSHCRHLEWHVVIGTDSLVSAHYFEDDARESAARLKGAKNPRVIRIPESALASSKPSPAFVAMREAIQYIMDGVAYSQKSMPGGRDVLLDTTLVHVPTQYLIKARTALALAEKEAGTTATDHPTT
jgi:hypothetical protein